MTTGHDIFAGGAFANERRPKPPCTCLLRVVSYRLARKQKLHAGKVA